MPEWASLNLLYPLRPWTGLGPAGKSATQIETDRCTLVSREGKDLRPMLNILPVDQDIVDKALSSGFSDFENALQYHAAIAGGLSIFVTRNQKDFKKAQITICNAKEYLELLRS